MTTLHSENGTPTRPQLAGFTPAAPTTPLGGALMMAKRGFHVLPIRPFAKDPLTTEVDHKQRGTPKAICGGVNKGTRDPKKIRRWFELEPELNYGIRADNLVILDVDPDKGGLESLKELGELPPTLRLRSQSGGIHIPFANFETTQADLAPGINIRSGSGGYVVGPGSRFRDPKTGEVRVYSILADRDVAEFPEVLHERMAKRVKKAADVDTTKWLVEPDLPENVAWARDFVAKRERVEHGSINNTLVKHVGMLKDHGISEDLAWELLQPWLDASGCDNREKSRESTASIYRNGQRPPGIAVCEPDFESIVFNPQVVADPAFAAWRAKTLEKLGLQDNSTPPVLPSHGFRWVYDRGLGVGVNWLLDQTIPETGTGSLSAPWGHHKTGVLIHLLLCTTSGRSFFGREVVRPGGAIFIAGEGGYAVPTRVRAAIRHQFPDLPEPAILFLDGPPPSLLMGAELAAFVQRLRWAAEEMLQRHGVRPRIVAFDTYATSFLTKDEDSSAEATAATKAMQTIARSLDAAVIATDHFGKDEKRGQRGSSAKLANADYAMTIPKIGSLHLLKVKDAPDGPIGQFSANVVPVGTDAKGRPVTSYVIQEVPEFTPISATGPEAAPAEGDADPRAVRELAEAIASAIREHGETVQHPTRGAVQAACVGRVRQSYALAHGGTSEAIRKAFKRSLALACGRAGAEVFLCGPTEYVALKG